ncbi:20981_t:CDS:2 [Gigaspora margarita]|uniref:20981_t:CDS:1 n=1 Tax=Gigaspora margarita TaxID=4874 RepID=A0ABN7V224_GIGMA|nr:20981_t:CDS:2 [Gigaspora margarita]
MNLKVSEDIAGYGILKGNSPINFSELFQLSSAFFDHRKEKKPSSIMLDEHWIAFELCHSTC